MKFLIKALAFLSFLPIWWTNQIFLVGLRIGLFFEKNCYALLFSSGFLLPFLCLFWRINLKFFENKPFLVSFFNYSNQGLYFFLSCFIPSICFFFFLSRKPKNFFAKFFEKMKPFSFFFVLLAKIEFYHFQKISFGFLLYFFFISFYLFLFKTLSLLNFYLFFLIVRFLLYIFITFRACFHSPRNFLMKNIFWEFDHIFLKLQEEKIVSNRFFLLQFYFLFALALLCFEKKEMFF